jgi:REP element-mobilizing transposase RayT
MKRDWVRDSLSPYFLTQTTLNWTNYFVNSALISIILESFNFYRFKNGVKIYGYVIMPNHIHYIAQFNQEKYGLSEFTRDFKSTITKKLFNRLSLMINETCFPIDKIYKENNVKIFSPIEMIDLLKNSGRSHNQKIKLWQDDEMPIILEYEEMAVQRLNYLHENPVRKGWVEKPEDFIYSSARFYESGDMFPFRVTHLFK